MVEFTAKDRAADAAYELATSPRDEIAGAREELNQIWQSGNLPAHEIGQALEENGLLAPLALYDSENLDTDHNGSFSYPELLSASLSEESDTLTKTLAEHLASEVGARNYEEVTPAELRTRSGEPVDPIPGELDFDPSTAPDGQIGVDELAYANEHFEALDGDNNSFVTADEVDEYSSNHADSLSTEDAAKLQDLSAQNDTLDDGADDEYGWWENNGFTRDDLHAAATEMADDLNEQRAIAGEDSTSAESILSSADDDTVASNDALAKLSNADSSTEEQLAAIKTLVEAGQTTATIRDSDGTSLTVRLEVQPVAEGSDRSFVHMFAVDENGRETVVLRALTDGDGFAQQRDANGNFISYTGSRWLEGHPNSVFGE
jgi:hypothetical protein